jgi:hypothetical protein
MLMALFIALFTGPVWAIDDDERVILFPASASLGEDGRWHAPVRSWIFEPEEDSITRRLLIGQLKNLLDLETLGAEQEALFERRIRWFLVDSEGGEELTVQVEGRQFPLPESAANGQSQREIAFTSAGDGQQHTRMTLVGAGKPESAVDGVIQLVPEVGLSVISDIDDTIKISEVTDKRKLLENTFLKPFSAPPGMADFYQVLAQSQAVFHYVSASPWQLYRELSDFMTAAAFPPGDFYLKKVRFTDSTLFNLFEDASEYKRPIIEALFKRYPQRCFILIGDNGEADPAIYAELARDWPEQLARIYIRRVTGGDEAVEQRFSGIPEAKWRTFDDNEISEVTAEAREWFNLERASGRSGCVFSSPPNTAG